MDASSVDWSMGLKAARLADWSTALEVGKRVSGPGPRVAPPDRVLLSAELNELVAFAESLVVDFTGLEVRGFRARAWTMGRGDWIRQNLGGLQRLLEPLAERIVEKRPERSVVARKALGAQIGALLGYVARRVLGQYDAFLPPDDDGLLYFVGPNLIDVERRFGLPSRDFRLWVAIHEVTHRVQFAAAPWLRSQLSSFVAEYLDSVSLDPRELTDQLKRAVEQVAAAGDLRSVNPLTVLLTPEQRAIVERTQAMMSILEGHASWVMNEVAKDHVEDLPRLRKALAARRRANAPERALQRAIGFDQKVRQYDVGERFVREVASRAGMDGVNLVWRGSGNLPSTDEVADPASWLARVEG
ncbi:MAG TPA: zinc-dependent metalloprotease [Actinomycetota bacterium]